MFRRWNNTVRVKSAIGGGVALIMIGVMLVGAVLVARPAQQVHASPTDRLPTLGINFNSPGAAGDRVFADAMKTGRPNWDSATNFGDGKGPAVDANGWPTGDASNMVWEGVSNNDGTYQLSFNGQATLSTSFGYGSFSNQQYNASTNTTTATMVITDTGAENFSLAFTNTKRTADSATNTGVTNIKLMRPTSEGASSSYDPSVTFTDQYKNAIAPYTYIRFMAGTNWNTSKTWSDRTRPLDFNQRKTLPNESGFEGNNIAFEYMVQLCNETGKDLYVNIPHLVDDTYVTNLANLILYGSDGVNPYTSTQSNPVFAPLRSDLRVYIEYSNETWNWSFQQAHDINSLAQAEVQANPGSPLNYDNVNNTGYWGWRYYARRILQISTLFRGVFGNSAMMTRVRPLLEWQYDNGQDTADQELNFLNNYYDNADGQQHVSNPEPVNYYIWGGGGAVYYGSNNDSAGTVDGIYASGIPASGYQSELVGETSWAHAFNLYDVAYEGGFAVGGDNPTSVQQQSRFDPRAKQSMIDSFNDFAAAGGDLYTAGTYTQWQSVPTASSAPLVQAAATINGSGFTPPAVNLGTAVAATGQTSVTPSPDTLGNSFGRPNTGQSAFYVLNVASAGSYDVTITTNQYGPDNGGMGQAQLFVNDQAVSGPTNMPPSSTIDFGNVTLQAGLNSLRVFAVHGTSDPAYPNDTFHDQWQPSAITLTASGNTTGWTKCADENGTCTFSGTMVVRYGANGNYNYQTLTNGTACNNATFGDPAVGTFKACYTEQVPPSGWTKCADENSTCTVPGTVTVAYGANGKFSYHTVTSSTACNNATFGDPNVGTFKACYYA